MALLAASPAAVAAPSTPPVTFIEALVAVPEATSALAAARLDLQLARVRLATLGPVADSAHIDLDTSTETARMSRSALVRADLALADTQATVDDTARTMYTAGGTAPTLVDVLLTADSELGFSRGLVVREYLASAAEHVVEVDDLAYEDRQRAATRVTGATVERERAATAVAMAEATVAAAAVGVAATETAEADARATYRQLMRMTRVDRSAEYGRIRVCGDWLTRLLSRSGFEGEDLREAWAIVMRESGGRADSVSETGDLGLFQINTRTWKDEDWFDRTLLLKRRYNSQIAFQLSRGGRTWYSWGLDGHGRPDPGAYVKSGWSDQRITSHIVLPYIRWYAEYPCRPAYEGNAPAVLLLTVPEPPIRTGLRSAGPSTSPR